MWFLCFYVFAKFFAHPVKCSWSNKWLLPRRKIARDWNQTTPAKFAFWYYSVYIQFIFIRRAQITFRSNCLLFSHWQIIKIQPCLLADDIWHFKALTTTWNFIDKEGGRRRRRRRRRKNSPKCENKVQRLDSGNCPKKSLSFVWRPSEPYRSWLIASMVLGEGCRFRV